MILTLEAEAHRDQCAELSALFEALLSRHGDRFRDLERRIRNAVANIDADGVLVFSLGDGRLIATVPAFADLLREGRALGVI